MTMPHELIPSFMIRGVSGMGKASELGSGRQGLNEHHAGAACLRRSARNDDVPATSSPLLDGRSLPNLRESVGEPLRRRLVHQVVIEELLHANLEILLVFLL